MRALLLFGFLLSGGVDGPVVYYGDLEGAKKPCQVKARKVFSQISDYKKIKEMGLTEDDAEYWILLEKANAKFNTAVHNVATEKGYDLVVEKGTVKFRKSVPDETQAVISAIP
ncbi:MAG: hypothetical protein QF645_03900 [Planctomycetota bacterium]|nr:hypothetical protein [Planctomycetota bacterium]